MCGVIVGPIIHSGGKSSHTSDAHRGVGGSTEPVTRVGHCWLARVQAWPHVGIQRDCACATELDPMRGACDNSAKPSRVEWASCVAAQRSTLNVIYMPALEEDGGEGSAVAALGSGERHRTRIRQALRG